MKLYLLPSVKLSNKILISQLQITEKTNAKFRSKHFLQGSTGFSVTFLFHQQF